MTKSYIPQISVSYDEYEGGGWGRENVLEYFGYFIGPYFTF